MKAIELGASLYVPAIKTSLLDAAYGSFPDLKSIIICLEDVIHDDHVDEAERSFARTLDAFCVKAPACLVYARPRNIAMLGRMLNLPGIEHVRGFVLPKVTTESLPQWIAVLARTDFEFMPTIESEEAFDRNALSRLCDQLRPHVERVTAVRIGGNDILNLMGVRRSRTRTAYEGPLGPVIRDIAGAFIPHGFAVAAPVFEHYSALDVLREEVERDIEHGLLTKAAVHPMQIAAIQDGYRPTAAELSEARAILDKGARAVFGSDGSMCEPATHRRWASLITQRARVYGVKAPICSANSLVA